MWTSSALTLSIKRRAFISIVSKAWDLSDDTDGTLLNPKHLRTLRVGVIFFHTIPLHIYCANPGTSHIRFVTSHTSSAKLLQLYMWLRLLLGEFHFILNVIECCLSRFSLYPEITGLERSQWDSRTWFLFPDKYGTDISTPESGRLIDPRVGSS